MLRAFCCRVAASDVAALRHWLNDLDLTHSGTKSMEKSDKKQSKKNKSSLLSIKMQGCY